MEPRPALRLRVLAGAILCAAVVLFSFSVFSTANAGATPSPIDGVLSANMRFVQSLSGQINSLKIKLDQLADAIDTKQLSFERGSGDTMTVQTLCIGSTCITESQLQQVLAALPQDSTAEPMAASTSTAPTQDLSIVSEVANSTSTTDLDTSASTTSVIASSTSPVTSDGTATSTDGSASEQPAASDAPDTPLFTSPAPDDTSSSAITAPDSTTTP